MTPREAIDELKARAAVVRSDFDDTADAADGAAGDVLAAIRSDLADDAREMAALDLAIASLEAFGGVDERLVAPALRARLLEARRDFPHVSIVLVGYALRGHAPHAGEVMTSPVLRVSGQGRPAVADALALRGFLVWGRE